MGKGKPPMIRSDDFLLTYSLSIQWWLKGGDRNIIEACLMPIVVSVWNLKGGDRIKAKKSCKHLEFER